MFFIVWWCGFLWKISVSEFQLELEDSNPTNFGFGCSEDNDSDSDWSHKSQENKIVGFLRLVLYIMYYAIVVAWFHDGCSFLDVRWFQKTVRVKQVDDLRQYILQGFSGAKCLSCQKMENGLDADAGDMGSWSSQFLGRAPWFQVTWDVMTLQNYYNRCTHTGKLTWDSRRDVASGMSGYNRYCLSLNVKIESVYVMIDCN